MPEWSYPSLLLIRDKSLLWTISDCHMKSYSPSRQTKGSFVVQRALVHFPSSLRPPQSWEESGEVAQFVYSTTPWLVGVSPTDHSQDPATPVFFRPIHIFTVMLLFATVLTSLFKSLWLPMVARSVCISLQYIWASSQVFSLVITWYSREICEDNVPKEALMLITTEIFSKGVIISFCIQGHD